QSARDIAFALEALSSTNAASGAAAAMPADKAGWPRWIPIAAALAVGVAGGAYGGAAVFSSKAHPVTFAAKTWDAQWITNARFAPDGQALLFSAARIGNIPSVFVIRP